eukprot:114836_1
MSHSNDINNFTWDQHVIKDQNMGYILVLCMNSEQKRLVQTYNPNQTETQSFPTALSLPFMNNSNQWKIQTRWNNMNKIYDSDAYNIAAQLEKMYMAFVGEAINRPYTMLNKYDPVNFLNEVLHQVQQLTVNTYIKWKNKFGRITAKISQDKNVYEWRLNTVEVYVLQVINTDETISNRRVTFTSNYINITADPSDISIYSNEQDTAWAILEYSYQTKSQQLQILEEIWNKNTIELDLQITKAIAKYLQNKYVNKEVDGISRKCIVTVKPTEFEHHLLSKSESIHLHWNLESKHNNAISVSLFELKQFIGVNAGERIHVVKIKRKKSKKQKDSIWRYYGNIFHFRYSYACEKLFIKFKVLGQDPTGDVQATA